MKKIFIFIVIFSSNLIFLNADIRINPIIVGKENSKVDIIVYESLTCSFCANFHKKIYPSLKTDYIDKGLVRIEFKSFPLDLAALNASKIAHCKNDGKSEILHLLFENQEKWVTGETIDELNKNLKDLIKSENLDLDFEKCTNNKDIEDFVINERIEGVKKYKVNSTPTIIINGKKFEKTLNFKNLKKIIEKLI
ncbi:MAG: disulfide bond formation protein DsbA [Pelagibacteraceae bacterium TMED268]|nr:MAG: disulfide bond formation protein DsbA [Pelagibacteraceae bacterium TMED268]|tara:strand:+ start:22 stop:603 length:582 start_codon:yes stop_codon:yes gene_type:complete